MTRELDPVWTVCRACGGLVARAREHVRWHQLLGDTVPALALVLDPIIDPTTGDPVQNPLLTDQPMRERV